MHASRRLLSGAAIGAGTTALVGSLLLGSPSGATEASYSFAKPEAIDAVPAAVLVAGEQQLVGAAGAGSYVVERVGEHLTIVSASPAAGWKVDVLHNDGEMVKAVFSSATTMVFAVATLGDDGIVAVEAFEKAIPVVTPPPVKAAVAKVAAVQAKTFGTGDHDGWCDKDGDGERDGFDGASFDGDWDGDRDGKRHHRDGDRDRWDGDED